MAKYKTTRALSKKGGIISTGGTVSPSHPRFDEGIRKGWIVKIGRDAKSKKPLPVSPKETETTNKLPEVTDEAPASEGPPKLENVVEEILGTHELGDPGLEATPTDESNVSTADSGTDTITIDELDFIYPQDEAALLEKQILEVSDLKGWSVEELMVIRGIGKSKATQLLDAYDEWEKSQIGK